MNLRRGRALNKAMKQAIALLAPLLAACGGDGGNEASGPAPRAVVQTAQLTGLYEAPGEGAQSSRLCMVSKPNGAASFGLVSETPGGSCSGTGEAVRTGNALRLIMAGDEQCVIEAQIGGTQVTFPSAVPVSCAYYCGPGATISGESFEKTGGTLDDAMSAADLAGDPLCG